MEQLRTFEYVLSRDQRALAPSRLYRFASFRVFSVFRGKKSSKTLGHSHVLDAPSAKNRAISIEAAPELADTWHCTTLRVN
jgi:hypothetical protein